MKPIQIKNSLLIIKIIWGVFLLTFTVNGQNVKPISKNCFECHKELPKVLKKKNVHPLYKENNCTACHSPHASRQEKLLTDDANELCLSCHQDFKKLKEHNNNCSPILKQDCMACHEHHGGDFVKLIKKPFSELCGSCHQNVKEWFSGKNILHDPLKKNNCQTCHSHCISDSGKVFVKEDPALCYDCHKLTGKLAKSHDNMLDEKTKCLYCHDAHASPSKNLLYANKHEPFVKQSCASCHNTLKTFKDSAKTLSPENQYCLSCHKDSSLVRGQEFGHNLIQSIMCKDCHNSHVAPSEGLLKRAPNQICMECHFQEVASNKREFHGTHPKTQCSDCHASHLSDNENYFNINGTDMCKRCHDGSHKSAHPQGAGIVDPRNSKTMDCLSCHQLHGAPFPDYLPFDPKMELCIQCHKF